MKRLLITGASGLVGRSLVKHCSSRYDLVGTYNTREYKPDDCRLLQLDISNTAEVEDCLDNVRPSIVIHTAGLSSIAYCQENKEEAEDINYRATAQLAAFCTKRGIKLIYLSTDMVFNGEKGNYSEKDKPIPINHYGSSKFAAEEAIKEICENYVIARLNLVYGKGQALKKSFSDRILIANWSGKPYSVYKGQVRSPISLDVASRAIRELAEGDFSGTYHLGGKEAIDRWDFAMKMVALMKIEPTIIEEAEVPEEIADIYPINTSFSVEKAASELKTELLSIEEGLKLEYGRGVS